MSIISVKNVSLEYDGNTVLSDLSFNVNEGDYLCIVGENGSGKSTLMKAILGLKKVSGGKIVFSDGLKQNEIGYLPQINHIQKDFPASVKEIVLSGTLNSCGRNPFYLKKQKLIADKNMEFLGISDIKNECYQNLSGGQQQRVLLARAMCATKKILLLDEPVTGLDPIVTSELYNLIYDLNRKSGITVIMISHDINASVLYSTHILHLHNKPLFFGTSSEYLKSSVYKNFSGGDLK